MTLRITTFAQLERTRLPVSGVGRHAVEMIRGLAARPEFSVELLAAKNELSRDGDVPADNGLAGMPVRALPMSRRTAEWMWKSLGVPAIDRWCPGADWLYCPAESYVPVRRARLAVTVHDLHAFEDHLPWSRTLRHRKFTVAWRLMFARLKRHADLFLAVSEFTRRRLIERLNIDPGRIVVVGNGVSDIFYQQHAMPGAGAYVLVVGGLSPRKGGDIVLAAASQLEAHGSEMPIWVAGRNATEMAAAAERHKNIRLLGPTSDADLATLYRGAAALFLPSRYEGFGIPVVEAFTSGLPVVCSSAGALPEVAGDAALLHDCDDVDGAVESLLCLREDAALREGLIQRGRQRAEALRWHACVDRLAAALVARSEPQSEVAAATAAVRQPSRRDGSHVGAKRRTSTVVITSHNRREDLQRTCRELRKLNPPPDETIVCLDGCTDGSSDMLQSEFPHIVILVNQDRLGSIPSRDRAFRLASSELIVTLDDDSYPTDAAFLLKVSQLAELHPECGAFTFPEIRDDGLPANPALSTATPGKYVRDFPNCAGVMRRDCYGRDAEYVPFYSHGHAEPDYCLQLYAAGYAVWFEPSLTVRHHFTPVLRNMQSRHVLNARNELWSAFMRCPMPLLTFVVPWRVMRQLLYAATQGASWLIREPNWWFDAARGLPRVLRQRQPIAASVYWSWLRLARRPIFTLKELQQRFGRSFTGAAADACHPSSCTRLGAKHANS